MKKTITSISLIAYLLLGVVRPAVCQEAAGEKEYNRWSVEFRTGTSSPISPFTLGAYSKDPEKYFNFEVFNTYELGVRFMYNETFGIRLNGFFDYYKSTGASLPFKTHFAGVGLQGIANIGNLFGVLTSRPRLSFLGYFGVLAGVQTVMLDPPGPQYISKGDTEGDAAFSFGLSPQYKIFNNVALSLDVGFDLFLRGHFAWDGLTYVAPETNLIKSRWNATVGLAVSFGKHKIHADFVKPEIVSPAEIREQFAYLEKRIQDLESKPEIVVPDYSQDIEAIKSQLDDYQVHLSDLKLEIHQLSSQDKDAYYVFFDTDRYNIEKWSLPAIAQVVFALLENPTAIASIQGFADPRAGEAYNKALSQRRADAIKKVMVDAGIDPARVNYSGEGIDMILPHTYMALNRRVTITLTY